MKLRYIFTALVAALGLTFVSCEQETEYHLSEIQVSSSYVAIPAAGGTVEVNVTAQDAWAITGAPDWLTVAPASGAAGDAVVKFTADAATESREASLALECAGKKQIVNVIQVTEKQELKVSSIADVIAAGEGTFRVKGTVTKIVNTQYGNFYVDDGTSADPLYVYGVKDEKGYPKDDASGWARFGIDVGDIVTVEGPYTFYNNTTPEFVDATVIKVEKSLIKVEAVEPAELPAEGGNVEVTVSSKVSPIIVTTDVDWLKLTDLKDGNVYVLTATANEKTAARKATITVKGAGAIATAEVNQLGVPPTGASVTEIIAAADNSQVETLESTVVALTTAGAVISDGTNAIYAYGSSIASAAIGDVVKVWAKKTTYNGVPELTDITEVQKTGTATVTYPAPKDVTATATEYTAAKAEFISLTGTLSVSGKYYNITVEGVDAATKQGSINSPIEALGAAALNGKEVTVTGYFNGLSSGGKYLNIVATKVVEANAKGSANNPYTVTEITSLILGGNAPTDNVYIKGKVSAILYAFDATHQTGTFWISDDGVAHGISSDFKKTTDPANDFECYSVYWLDNKPWAEGDGQPEIGDEVVICGLTTLYNGIAETSSKKAWVHSWTPAAGGSGIKVDGSFDDWAVEGLQTFAGINDRILEWKFASDSQNLYFYYKITASKIKADGSSKIYVGFDLDNDATTGDQGEHGGSGPDNGSEALAYFYPWNGTTAVISGEDPESYVKCPTSASSTGKVTVGGKIEDGFAYVEFSIPRSAFGTALGSSFTVRHAMQYYKTNREVVNL